MERLAQKSQAKLAEEKALGHTAALTSLVKELPAGKRTPEDEAYLNELLQEGHQLRAEARDSHADSQPVVVRGEVLTPHDRQEEVRTRVEQGHAYQR